MQFPVAPRDATVAFASVLTEAGAHRFTGILRITGEPGGDIRFVDGLVVAVITSGAPGVALLDHGDDRPHGLAHTRLLRMTAVVDATFAIAAGWVDRGRRIDAEPAPIELEELGYDPRWLLDETERRLGALTHAGLSPHRNLLTPTPFGRSARQHTEGIAGEILRLSDGTRTCRDLAFLLGRSLYPVTVEVARLLSTGHLTVPLPRAQTPIPVSGGDSALPRRRRGASGINDTLRPRPPQPVFPSATAVDAPDAPLLRGTERIL
ncbi:hypothetical protein [Nocardia lasii]|uniref:DUF4388 domain-containing protein n=1 Tax=Nocardia lasii TaxID=1616107 RepID=A0ABW1JSF0_9NOCA